MPNANSTPGAVRLKPGTLFTTIAPAGFRLLAAIEGAARACRLELTITSACDGEHSGPDDPHHRGEAYDVRTHGLSDWQKVSILDAILRACLAPGEGPPAEGVTIAVGWTTSQFFGFLEAAGTDNEHIHVQLRKGRTYP